MKNYFSIRNKMGTTLYESASSLTRGPGGPLLEGGPKMTGFHPRY